MPAGSTPYRVVFEGATGGANQPLLVANGKSLSGAGAEALVAEMTPGGVGFEVCEPSRDDACGEAASGYATPNFTGGSIAYYPNTVAVDQESGAVYAASFNRINRYSAAGAFERSFGWDAVFSGPGDGNVDETEQLVVTAAGGTYTLTFNYPCCGASTTQPIPFDWPAADPGTPEAVDSVEEALNATSSIKGIGGRVTVSGGPGDSAGASPYMISFHGTLAGDDVPQLSADGTELAGSPSGAEVSTPSPGGGPEVCLPERNDACGTIPPGGSDRGGAIEHFFGSLAVVPASAPGAGNVIFGDRSKNRLTEFTAAGAFVRTFGWDVNDAGGAEFEVCAAGETCKAGVSGSAVGQFNGINDLAIDPGGAIYVLERGGNRRVQKLTPSGGSFTPSLFGQIGEQQSVTVRATAGSYRLASTESEGTVGNRRLELRIAGRLRPDDEQKASSGSASRSAVPSPRAATIVAVTPNSLTASANSTSSCASSCEIRSTAVHETADLPATATAAEVKAALDALPTIGGIGGSVSVTGGPGDAAGSNPYVVSFDGGAIAATDPAQLAVLPGSTPLSGGTARAPTRPASRRSSQPVLRAAAMTTPRSRSRSAPAARF